MTVMRALSDLGQSVWLDYLHRDMTRSGALERMVHDGLRGVTSNPTIFERALGSGNAYDRSIAELADSALSDRAVYETLAIQDVQEAADVLSGVYWDTDGADGFVSLEVSPDVARDAKATVAEARRLWQFVNRPNVMIKIPGTREAWPAIEQSLRDGININVTLLFSIEHYEAVADAYIHALEARVAQGLPISHIASAASLFVSRVDAEIDRRIDSTAGALASLRGRTAIANAQLVYARFRELLDSPRWKALQARGARPQRPLWASTGTKDPAYSDIRYVQALIGPQTITTVPPDTLRLFEDHGVAELSLPGDSFRARRTMNAIAAAGIRFSEVNFLLEEEGLAKFARSLTAMLAVIHDKRAVLSVPAVEAITPVSSQR
ncbi:MAG TPA: transaldolase [Gemmatimonadaceae bacterium]